MTENQGDTGTYSKPAEIGTAPADKVTRWLLELDLAHRNEKDWLKRAGETYDRYRSEKQRKNSFNILWPNTETLSQAIYNTLPKPDVRRRYRDADPVAKLVSDVLERSVDYSMDVYDFDQVLKQDLLDMLLPGRGVSRVKYVPDFEDMDVDTEQAPAEAAEDAEKPQRIAYERVICEHVNWQDFRHGPGKTWDEVRWVAFRHKISRIAGVKMFGDIYEQVVLDAVADEEVKKHENGVGQLFKTGEVWEIWDRDDESVTFISTTYKVKPLKETPDPLELDGFFPCPRPIYAIQDSDTLVPAILFEKYKQQADELDRISSRINNLTDALKVRGVYNAVLDEISQMQDAADNVLVAAKSVQALQESGGLAGNIWMMPIEAAAKVIQILNAQRDAVKAVIYELTGISDIMRGASDSQETFGAQKIKSMWGTQRLKKMQAEFQRYVRDIIRLKCQIIAGKFQIETIEQMTGIKLLKTEDERKQIEQQAQAFQQYQMMQKQQAQQQAMAQQAPPTPLQQQMQPPQPSHPMQPPVQPQQMPPRPPMQGVSQ